MGFMKKNRNNMTPPPMGDNRGEADGEVRAHPVLERLTSHFEAFRNHRPDLCRRVEADHPAAEAVNGFFRRMETQFRHLLESMIGIIDGEKELSGTVGRLRDEAKSQERGSGEILREGTIFSESLTSLMEHTEETTRTAERAVHSADEGREELDLLLGHIESIGSNMDETWRDMEKLNSASGSINELTSLISDTAERLHLISVNTAIEASRSRNGGFQVIAREIQKMALETTETVTRVDGMVQNILDRIGEVERALLSSQESTRICLDKSEKVREAFRNIAGTNDLLVRETARIRDGLDKGRESVRVLFDTSRRISSSAGGISGEADRASALSENLVNIVSSVITEIGSYRLNWHLKMDEYCREGSDLFRGEGSYGRESLDRFLEKFLSAREGFELGYIMDGKGRQVSSNIKRTGGSGLARGEGYGTDRSDRTYFMRALKDRAPYLTDIYLSSATDELCVTAAFPVETGEGVFVIALDANLKGLISAA